jgi:hypothetical protein
MPRPRRNPERKVVRAEAHPTGGKSVLTPLSYLLQLLNDPTASQQRRDRAARTAAPYVHRRADSLPKKQRQAADAKKAGGKNTPWAGDLDGEWQQ